MAAPRHLGTDPILRLREGVAPWCDVDGEAVLLDLRAGEYLSANRSATLLWRALAAGTTREQLAGDLVASYGIDRSTAERGVDAFLDACRARGFLDG